MSFDCRSMQRDLNKETVLLHRKDIPNCFISHSIISLYRLLKFHFHSINCKSIQGDTSMLLWMLPYCRSIQGKISEVKTMMLNEAWSIFISNITALQEHSRRDFRSQYDDVIQIACALHSRSVLAVQCTLQCSIHTVWICTR